MDKPRIFLGSSGKQEKLLQALTRGLEDVARVEPWTTSFNPGTTTLERLLELAHEVDFAAFVFAQDDWTSTSLPDIHRSRIGAGFSPRQCRFRSGTFRRTARDAADLHPPGKWLKASKRSTRPHLRALRRSPGRYRDRGSQPKASDRDRERRTHRPHRGPVVAVLSDRAHRK